MRKGSLLLSCVVVLALANLALAQGAGYGGTLGIYFSESQFDGTTMTIYTPPFVPFRAYVVLTDAQHDGVAAYECSVQPMHQEFLMLAVGGPVGFVNFGDVGGHMVGYQTPLPVDAEGNCVLSWIDCLPLTDEQVDLVMGPSSFPSIPGWDGPAIVFAHDFDLIYHLDLSSGAHGFADVVAVVNPTPVATEARSLSAIKRLFD
jgi:hypothetical protein